jgi:hypothetical protein
MFKKLLITTTLLVLSAAALAGPEQGSAAEGRAMLSRAVAALKADKDRAIDSFNHNDATFRDRDLFVFCFNGGDGRLTAHEAMVTHDVRRIRDSAGHPIGEVMYRAAVEDAVVEVTYSSPLPGSTSPARKRAFITRVDDQVCGVSVYELDTQTASAR